VEAVQDRDAVTVQKLTGNHVMYQTVPLSRTLNDLEDH